MNQNNCLFRLSPVKKYEAPKYPVYIQARNNPDLLKKLPSRWQKNANVIGCLGTIGMLTLTGCPPFFGNNICSECGFAHHGGSGGAPIYIIYLTEQEALSLIQTKAQEAGLNLDSELPDYTVPINVWNKEELGLDFYDEEKDVALTLVNLSESGYQWCNVNLNKNIAETAKKEFAKLENDTTVGVFYNPAKPFGFNEPDEKATEDAEKVLSGNLAAQVQEFINWLQAQGIIQ